jgi:hypothetical protein
MTTSRYRKERPVRLRSVLSKASSSVEHAHRIDRLADPLNELVGRRLPPGRVRSLISGTWLGHPLHPFLVSVPIGCWTSASLLDLPTA